MANQRTITLFFSSDGKEKPVETSVTTFGELKAQIRDYDLSNKKVIDAETRHVYEADEAILPETDCVLYIYVKKTKAGAGVPKEFKKITPDKLHTFPLDNIRKFASYINKTYGATISGKLTKELLQKELRKWMLKNSWPETVAITSPGRASKGSAKMEQEVLEKVSKRVRVDIGEESSSKSASLVPESATGTKRIGPATLDVMDAKLDLILEALAIRTGATAIPRPTSREEMRKDAARLKDQLPGLA